MLYLIVLLILSTTDAECGAIEGYILSENGEHLVGSTVRIDGTQYETLTDGNGWFCFSELTSGNYEISADMISHYADSLENLTVLPEDTLFVELILIYKPCGGYMFRVSGPGILIGTVTDEHGKPLSNAIVRAIGSIAWSVSSNQTGEYIVNQPDSLYLIETRHAGFFPDSIGFISDNTTDTIKIDIVMNRPLHD